MTTREEVLKHLNPLIDQAEREGKYLYSYYQGIWFSPAELRKQNANGSFCWGPCNWALRDPKEKTSELKHEIKSKTKELKKWERKTK